MSVRRTAAGFVTLALVAATATGCRVVDEYEGAVVRNPWTGSVSEEAFDQGLYRAFPIALRDFTKYDLREVQYPTAGQSEQVTALTSDQLKITLDAAFRYRLQPDALRELFVTIGDQDAIHDFVYNTYRSAVRDAVSEIAAADILSTERAGIAERVDEIMTSRLSDRGIEVTEFFVRDIDPPPAIRQAIEAKLKREQQVQAERYQTQIVQEQANQRREEAEGIRDAQNIIAESLVGARGQRYLYWRALEAMEKVGEGENNMIIVPTEGGAPIFFGAPNR